ncbi:MAG: hypothetical protein ABI369_05380 [Acetobacteraceae bacterium]
MMRKVLLVALLAMPSAGPLLAQPAHVPDSAGARSGQAGRASRSPETPVDHGPYTAEANCAYQGGGMILQGAPGAPAPKPEPTPPGQTPRNMVPPR